jgi:hypothetical protein
MKRKILLIASSLLLLVSKAYSHSYVVYSSTPLCPPLWFIWILPLFILMYFILNLRMRRKLCHGDDSDATKETTWSFLIFFAAVFVVFNIFYIFGANWVWFPSFFHVFWGWSWNIWLILFFVIANLLTLSLLLLVLYSRGKFWRPPNKGKWKPVMKANALLYCVCIMPFILTGAFVHGWASVSRICENRLRILDLAIMKYAQHNNWILPKAKTFQELKEKIEPYLVDNNYDDTTICPEGGAYFRNPDEYIWDSNLSGKPFKEMVGDIYSLNLEDKKPPLKCPYHKLEGAKHAFKTAVTAPDGSLVEYEKYLSEKRDQE